MSESRSYDDGGSQSYSDDGESGEDSQSIDSYGSASDSDYNRSKRRRDQKASDKQKDKGGRKSTQMIKIDSSDDSDDSADYQKKRSKDAHSGDQRSKVSSQIKPKAHAVE